MRVEYSCLLNDKNINRFVLRMQTYRQGSASRVIVASTASHILDYAHVRTCNAPFPVVART